jgi:hypothetical protein
MPGTRTGDALLRWGAITPVGLKAALQAQESTTRESDRLGHIIAKQSLVEEDMLASALGAVHQMP